MNLNLNPFGDGEGITGVDEKRNLLILIVVMVVPFYFIIIGALVLDSVEVSTEFIIMEVFVGIMGWILFIGMWYIKVKSKTSSIYCFESAKVKFDETTVRTLDLKFYPRDVRQFEKLTPEGRYVYAIPWLETYGYEHPTEGNITFNKSFIVMPFPKIPFRETFEFLSAEEIWDGGMLTECPNCEGASFHVSPFWEEIDGEWIPTFKVADSHIHYLKSLAKFKHIDKDAIIEIERSVRNEADGTYSVEIEEVNISELNDEVDALETLNAKVICATADMTTMRLVNKRLYEDRQRLLEDEKHFDKELQDRRDAFRKRHREILSEDTDLKDKLLNTDALVKLGIFAVTFLIIFGVIWLLSG